MDAFADLMMRPPDNPATPYNQGVRNVLHDLFLQPVKDAGKALAGKMTDAEAQDFAFGAALGLVPMGRGLRAARGGIRAYHGSPHDFDRFDMSKIGTGEGAQAYGHGLYFAENEGVARSYRDMLAGSNTKWTYDGKPVTGAEQNAAEILDRRGSVESALGWVKNALRSSRMADPKYLDETEAALKRMDPSKVRVMQDPGKMYEVNINAHPDQFLDWDKPLSKQPGEVQQSLGKVLPPGLDNMKGEQLYRTDLPYHLGVPKPEVPSALREAGIPGIKYLDQGSRTAGEGSRNYVVFDDKLIDILKKYGLAGLMAGGAATQADPLQRLMTDQ